MKLNIIMHLLDFKIKLNIIVLGFNKKTKFLDCLCLVHSHGDLSDRGFVRNWTEILSTRHWHLLIAPSHLSPRLMFTLSVVFR